MPARIGLVDAEGGHLVAQSFVLFDLEEELRDREVGETKLGREMLTIRPEIGRLWMPRRMRRHTDRLEAKAASELDQLSGVLELLVRLLLRKRISAEREQVLEARCPKAADDLAQLEAGMGDAGQVRHRREVGGPQEIDDDTRRPLARDPSTAIGDRNVGRSQRLEVGDRPSQKLLFDFVLGGKNSNEKVCPAARRSVIRAMGRV